jgi:hypothetical protein
LEEQKFGWKGRGTADLWKCAREKAENGYLEREKVTSLELILAPNQSFLITPQTPLSIFRNCSNSLVIALSHSNSQFIIHSNSIRIVNRNSTEIWLKSQFIVHSTFLRRRRSHRF